MQFIIEITAFYFISVQILFYVTAFFMVKNKSIIIEKPTEKDINLPFVTLLICGRNELANFKKNS